MSGLFTEGEVLLKIIPQIEKIIADAKTASQVPQVATVIADLEALVADVKAGMPAPPAAS